MCDCVSVFLCVAELRTWKDHPVHLLHSYHDWIKKNQHVEISYLLCSMPIHVRLAAFSLSCRGSRRAKATQLARSVYHFSGLDVEAGVGFGGHDDSSHGRLRASISAVLQTRLWRGCL